MKSRRHMMLVAAGIASACLATASCVAASELSPAGDATVPVPSVTSREPGSTEQLGTASPTPSAPTADVSISYAATGCRPGVELHPGELLTSGPWNDSRVLGPVGINERVVAATGGAEHYLAIAEGGSLIAWGDNTFDQTGTGSERSTNVKPTLVAAPDGKPGIITGVVEISADSDVSMARTTDGAVIVWGRSDAGQRGQGSQESSPYPTSVIDPESGEPLTDAISVAADGRTLLAALSDGRVLAWGANADGQLGDGTRENQSVPVFVRGMEGAGELVGASQVAVGGQHSLALLNDGRVVAWGSNALGQLGTGAAGNDELVPVPVLAPGGREVLDDAVAIAASELNSYALLANGRVLAWGNGSGAQLGDGQRVPFRPLPTEVDMGLLGTSIDCISAGEAFVAARLSDGTSVTWGSGGKGQLAAGETQSRLKPGLVQATSDLGKALGVGAAERQLFVIVESPG